MSSPGRVILAVVAFVAAGAAVTSAAGAVSEPARVDLTAFRLDPPSILPGTPEERAGRELAALVNEFRRSQGLPDLVWDPQITAAAQVHADYMASVPVLTHTGPGGTDTGDRLDDQGVSWLRWGENVGSGYANPALMLEAWLDSSSHRDNLLGDYERIGIGVAAYEGVTPYWALVLVGEYYLL